MTFRRQALIRLLAAPVESTLLQVPRALAASGLAAALDMALLVLLVEAAGWSALPAATLSYAAGGVLQYVLCSVWVFPHGPRSLPQGVLTFTVTSLVGLGITWVVIACLQGLVGYAAAKVVALGLAFVWNFLSRKYLIFRQPDPLPGGEDLPAGREVPQPVS
ncbi:MAG TPA: GtrA family protein [Gemmataceae bacterium]